MFMDTTMIEIDHTLLAPDTLDNLIIDVITRQTTDYGDNEMSIANKKSQLRRKLERGEAVIVYSHQEGFCNIINSDDNQTMKNQQKSQDEYIND
jgi:uncharacterized protein YheU (UPF0270 family)